MNKADGKQNQYRIKNITGEIKLLQKLKLGPQNGKLNE